MRLLYLGLCALQMLVLGASLVVAYRVEKTYSAQIQYEAVLNSHLRSVTALRVLADSAYPPAGDTRVDDWEDEASRVEYSVQTFEREAQQLLQEVDGDTATGNCGDYLRSLVAEIRQVLEQTKLAGAALGTGDSVRFRTHLLYADRSFSRAHTMIGNINVEISGLKDESLKQNTVLARRSRNYLLGLSVLGFLLVLPVTAYARRIARAIRTFEEKLQAERDALEHRVAARTAELRIEVEERRRIEQFDRCRNHLLEMVAEGAPLEDVLADLANTVELFCAPAQCLIVTAEGSAIAPNLSRQSLAELKTLLAAANTPIRRAQASGETLLISDCELEFDSPLREFVCANKIAAWWAAPFHGSDGKALGALSVLGPESRKPHKQELHVLHSAARLGALAIAHGDMQEELYYRAHHDSLTQLPNRRLCDDRINHAIARAERNGLSVGVLCIDLDDFKQINDVYGHDAGDHLLRTVATRLAARLRSTDTLARVGGDEFFAVLDEIRRGEDLEKIAEALRSCVAEPVVFGSSLLRITASIGGVLYPGDGNTAQELKMYADQAMYRAKERGRNAFQMFSAELSEKLAKRRQLESYLRDALERDGFELHYQPQYTLQRELIGLEALLRFRGPDLKMISPAEFIPVAEQTGLIVDIGDWVIRNVCKQGRKWVDQGLPPVRISMNVSALELAQDRFTERVAEALQASGFDPNYLQVEVTETAVMSNMDEARRHLCALEEMGVAVSVDDFGTGHSSLSYLHRLPIDSLKVDRSFIKQITQSGESVAIVRAIVAMANSLGLQVIAEGVETEAQLSAVAEVGCQFIQGYLFSRPLASDLIPDILAHSNGKPPLTAAGTAAQRARAVAAAAGGCGGITVPSSLPMEPARKAACVN